MANCPVVRKCLAPTRMYQNYMNGFFKATESIEVYFGMERRGSLRSRIRILPPRDPPGDGGRREGGGQVFTGTQLHTL